MEMRILGQDVNTGAFRMVGLRLESRLPFDTALYSTLVLSQPNYNDEELVP